MPIKDPIQGEDYHPTEGETRIVQKLRETGEKGLSYSEIREFTNLSDTALSHFLRRMQRYNLVIRDETRRYHITIVALSFLMSLSHKQISRDELKAQRRKDFEGLWRQVRSLQEKVLRVMWLPYADATSRLLFSSSGGGPDLVYIGALKSKDGKNILSIKTPDIKELQRLGYTWKERQKQESP